MINFGNNYSRYKIGLDSAVVAILAIGKGRATFARTIN